jgi:hypothetical protein
MGSQIYTRLPPCEGVWPVGGRASGYTPSQVRPRGGVPPAVFRDSSTYLLREPMSQLLPPSVGDTDGALTPTLQAQFHARRSGGRDESASDTGPCLPVEPAHVRAME